jgi:hypothetical protein
MISAVNAGPRDRRRAPCALASVHRSACTLHTLLAGCGQDGHLVHVLDNRAVHVCAQNTTCFSGTSEMFHQCGPVLSKRAAPYCTSVDTQGSISESIQDSGHPITILDKRAVTHVLIHDVSCTWRRLNAVTCAWYEAVRAVSQECET